MLTAETLPPKPMPNGETVGPYIQQPAPQPASNSWADPSRPSRMENGKVVYGDRGPVGSRYGSTSRGPATPGPAATATPQPGNGAVPGISGPSPMLAPGREDYRTDLQNSSTKMQGLQPLLNALPLIAQLGQTGSGPGTKPWQDAKSFLVSQGVISADATDVDVRDEANKYLKQYVAKSGIAQRSDMGSLVAEQSSPNLETSNKATQSLTRNSIAQDRMEAARPLAFDSDDMSGYSKYKAGWTQSQDPRAYQLDVMPADQRASLLKNMAANRTTPEGVKFFRSLKNAMTAHVVTPPNATAGASTDGQ